MKHKFSITISGDKKEATTKAQALGTLAAYLDAKTLAALADVAKNDPDKVALAKQFLGL
ncbi:MAG: hypothetical protein HUJ25_12485 [Crocinitomicaceae bacterium]|nr:hypothetical protein [Crocinitomicaceae bacterium]